MSVVTPRRFSPYVAIEVQTILDVNGGVIRKLKNSDCYLFVDFRRDPIGTEYRGSLFSNQEMAIAYAFGFERFLVINQHCPAAVERALDSTKWTPDYSRRLQAGELRWSDVQGYGSLVGRLLYVDIRNGRPDIAAPEATARLSEFGAEGGPWEPCPIRSPLKATGRPGFTQTIFPQSDEAFDLLCVGAYGLVQWAVPPASGNIVVPFNPDGVYLNSALDVVSAPRPPIRYGICKLAAKSTRSAFLCVDVGAIEA